MFFIVEQHKFVVIVVESKLFVQHCVDVEGEPGRSRWGSDGASVAVDRKGFAFADQPHTLTQVLFQPYRLFGDVL